MCLCILFWNASHLSVVDCSILPCDYFCRLQCVCAHVSACMLLRSIISRRRMEKTIMMTVISVIIRQMVLRATKPNRLIN